MTATNLVGFIGNIPVTFLVRGEKRVAAASSSWYVEPSVRGLYSIRLFNEFMKQKSASLFLFKAEEEYVMNFLTKYKFEEYILPASQKEYVGYPEQEKCRSYFFKIHLQQTGPQSVGNSGVVQTAGVPDVRDICSKNPEFSLPAGPGMRIPRRSVFPVMMNSYGYANPMKNPVMLVVSHDTKTLNWLYFSSARWFNRVVIQCRRSLDNTLAGYMVFDIERKKPSESGSMRLMEMFIEDTDPRVLPSLISCAMETGKQNNASLLVVWANSPETEAYFRSTFFLRRNVRHYRYLRFSDTGEMRSVNEDHGTVCPSLIYPPQ